MPVFINVARLRKCRRRSSNPALSTSRKGEKKERRKKPDPSILPFFFDNSSFENKVLRSSSIVFVVQKGETENNRPSRCMEPGAKGGEKHVTRCDDDELRCGARKAVGF